MIALTVEDDDPGGGRGGARRHRRRRLGGGGGGCRGRRAPARRATSRGPPGSARPTRRGFELATRLLRAEAGRGTRAGTAAPRGRRAIAADFPRRARARARRGKVAFQDDARNVVEDAETSSEEADDEEDEEEEDEDAEGPSMRFSVASAAWYLLLVGGRGRRRRVVAREGTCSSARRVFSRTIPRVVGGPRGRRRRERGEGGGARAGEGAGALLVRGGGIGNRDSAAARGDDSRGSIARRGLGVGALVRLAAASAGCLARLTALVDADGPGRG